MNHISKAVLSAQQIRNWDIFTMEKEFINSIALMEKAAGACLQWLLSNGYSQCAFSVFCGKGNNGGDGLALARLLAEKGRKVSVFILESGHKGTEDFQANFVLLRTTQVPVSFILDESSLHAAHPEDVIIDALFGSGLNRHLEGMAEKTVLHINNSGNEVISIDIPAGMFADSTSAGNEMIRATHTLSFQTFKLAFLVTENAEFTGNIHILPIGLTASYLNTIESKYELITPSLIKSIYKPRKKDSNKGDYGHAALIAGSSNMMGAALLAARACMRTGTGKLTCYIPGSGLLVMQMGLPEAITHISGTGEFIEPFVPSREHNVVGIGPGLGKYESNFKLLSSAFEHNRPMVIDADALNTLSGDRTGLIEKVPALSVLTPHPKEFERLFGKSANDFERIEKAGKKATELNAIIVLKGHYTLIAMPGGMCYFNTTGNPGMATAGSGDVLTGVITGLLAQHYTPEQAAVLGVYLHGLAGDLASEKHSEESMIASDITTSISEAFKILKSW